MKIKSGCGERHNGFCVEIGRGAEWLWPAVRRTRGMERVIVMSDE